jgi:hypothetical protein
MTDPGDRGGPTEAMARSSDGARMLVGLSLGEAFFKFVLEDPEVQLRAAEVLRQDADYGSVFREGQYPGNVVEYNWPLDVTADDLAFQFVRPMVWSSDTPERRASAEIVRACEVTVSRFQKLRGFLSGGILVARGTHAATGKIVVVDTFQWKRKGMLLDVQNSDVSDGPEHKPILRWTGLSLDPGQLIGAEGPSGSPPQSEQVFHDKHTDDDTLRPSTPPPGRTASAKPRRSAWKSSIGAAVSALWPNGIPATLTLKSRDDQIAAWQRENGLPVASSRTIRRHLTEDGHFRE